MPDKPPSFPRREFLTGIGAFGSLGALVAVILPGLPEIVRAVAIPLPTWANGNAQTARAYRAAMQSPRLLAQLPCYCGCMESPTLRHTNLRDCYFLADGSLNPHAAGCGICQSETLSAAAWQAEGLSVDGIHARIDETYGGASCTVDRCVE